MTLTSTAHAEGIRLAATTSFHNSGLSDVCYLKSSPTPAFTSNYWLSVQDRRYGWARLVIWMHSKAGEVGFVAQGYGTHLREIMYIDFAHFVPCVIRVGANRLST